MDKKRTGRPARTISDFYRSLIASHESFSKIRSSISRSSRTRLQMLLESRFTIVMLFTSFFLLFRRHSLRRNAGKISIAAASCKFPKQRKHRENHPARSDPTALHRLFPRVKSMKLVISQRSIHLFGDPARKHPPGEPFLFSPS